MKRIRKCRSQEDVEHHGGTENTEKTIKPQCTRRLRGENLNGLMGKMSLTPTKGIRKGLITTGLGDKVIRGAMLGAGNIAINHMLAWQAIAGVWTPVK